MIILPAIDLKDGQCVRLQKGEFSTVHQVAASPMEVAKDYKALGAQWIHMVDLDGALHGKRSNGALVTQTIRESGVRVELGGGMRSMSDVEEAFALGVARVVIGSAAVMNPDFVRKAVEKYGEKVAVGIDALDNSVRVSGWTQDSGIDYFEFARQMDDLGVKYFIFTDIATDGMLSGPAFEKLAALQQVTGAHIIASGGVTTNEDVRRLAAMGLYGAIVGKAYYAGTIDLAKAIEEAATC
jgi:phosphoribosylformimino-5-aminoimidazole carboxamide ribotide isomerase